MSHLAQARELHAFVERAAGGVAEHPQAPSRGQRIMLQREILLPVEILVYPSSALIPGASQNS